ncbi:hypothetical protein ANCCAN_06055 [Ancylostoma caninum]|uniref:MULE transposase domain-containing protein n=1 Tax=Ancylostoma caninum TaxID=29170 RepID=A0A368GU12_ANCCA|nr:hypothetical protein ANCCAN_06055 [Ancylostoma caninum]
MSTTTLQRAINNGLHVLIADGIHRFNPRSKRGSGARKEERQLYTIHGACRGGFEVRHKTEDDYVTVFGKLKEVLQSANTEEPGEEPRLRIVVDFEKAAIKAVRRVFPECSLEGCCWHLSQAWVRKRNTFGLLRFLRKREQKEPRVVRWWRTSKGIPFLPKDILHLVNALRTPPVEEEHPAYDPCKKFLGYFRNTWMLGPNEDMWCKYRKDAENLWNPPLVNLIITMRSLTAQAEARLHRMEMMPRESRALRRRDQIRREKVEQAMDRFERLRDRQFIITVLVGRYCRKMSRYTSDKAI